MGKPKSYACASVCLALTVLTIVLLSVSIHKLDSTTIGLKHDVLRRSLGGRVIRNGIHSGPVGFEFIKYPAIFYTENIETVCLSRDGLRVEVKSSYQVQINQTRLREITIAYRDFDKYSDILHAIARSVVQQSCSDFSVREFQERRLDIQNRQLQYMKERFAPYYAEVGDVQLTNVEAPRPWVKSVEAKETAREDIQLAQNEAEQAITKAETGRDQALERVLIIREKSEAQRTNILTTAEREGDAREAELIAEADALASLKANLTLTNAGLLDFLFDEVVQTAASLNLAVPANGTIF